MERGTLLSLVTLAGTFMLGGLAVIATAPQPWIAILGWVFLLAGAGVAVWLSFTQGGRWKRHLVGGAAVLTVMVVVFAIFTSRGGVEAEVVSVHAMTTTEATARGGTLERDEEGGVYVFFPEVRLTNHNFEPVSLMAKLVVHWQTRGVSSEHAPWKRQIPPEQWGHEFVYPPLPDHAPLDAPLNLASQSSVQGSLAFLLTATDLRNHGGWGEEDALYLVIEDVLSGESLVAYEVEE